MIFVIALNLILLNPIARATDVCSLHLTIEAETVTRGINRATARLAAVLARDNPSGNLNFSPLNLAQGLQVLHAGGGALQPDLARLLGLESLTANQALRGFESVNNKLNEAPKSTKITTSVSLWANGDRYFKFRAKFAREVGQAFKARVSSPRFSDPGTLRAINASVAERTEGMIPHLLPNLNPSLDALLISTLFIEGAWLHQFAEWATSPKPFHSEGEGVYEVPMMTLVAPLDYARSENFQIVRLPTRDQRAVMEVYRPWEGGARDKFLTHSFTETFRHERVRLSLPRFRVHWQQDVTKSFEQLLPLTKRPFTEDLRVTEVIHAAALEVHELGFRGAAATAMSAIAGSAALAPPIEMVVDRSFGLRILFVDGPSSVELFRTWVDAPEALATEGGAFMN